jgi:uncharacterized membrane protein YeiH
MIDILLGLLYISTAIFAYDGTKIALSYGNNVILSMFFGFLSACGGGTIRDIYNYKPIFWMVDINFLILIISFCILAVYC